MTAHYPEEIVEEVANKLRTISFWQDSFENHAKRILSLLHERGMLKTSDEFKIGWTRQTHEEVVKSNAYPIGKITSSDFKERYPDLVSQIQVGERERCANICSDKASEFYKQMDEDKSRYTAYMHSAEGCEHCEDAIRNLPPTKAGA